MKQSLTILHLYPDEMSIYGDRGNVLALVKRLEWRGVDAKVVYAGVGEAADIEATDIIFAGGGQDRGQVAVGEDLQRYAKTLHKLAVDGMPMLTICGTYQLFGHGFTTLEGQHIPGIGLFNAETLGSTHRMIGNIIVETEFGPLVGFENHSGQTSLLGDQQPMGKVIKGFGNNETAGHEGARIHNVFGTYLHGPVLPKNPKFTDALLQIAMQRKYGTSELGPLDNELELAAAQVSAVRPQ
jgi:lipid II isoglutaminyl synthase (glutamine-hydrolysing)